MFIALILAEEKVYILANNDFDVIGFSTLKKAKNYFENSYKSAHTRSYEGSMSACLNYITFQPSIIEIKDANDIKNNIANERLETVRLSHVSGFMNAIKTRESARELWSSGIKPKLI